jgi:hypothetical protein
MNKWLSVLSCLLVIFPSTPVPSGASQQSRTSTPQQTTAVASKKPILEDGTPVKLRFAQTVSSEDAHVNDRVEFEVLEEVTVADVIIIPKGGLAWGTVTEAKPKRRMARGGKLEIVLDSVRLVDGERAALRATKEAKGGGHTGAMTAGIVVTGLLIWPAAPFFLFMHGKEISIPKGTEVPTFVNGDFPLEMTKFQQAPSANPQLQATGSPSGIQPVAATQANTNAEIEITSAPSGAEIELDGSFVGSTPSTIGVAAGDHIITIKKNGYRPWERKLKTNTGKVGIAADLEADTKREQKVEVADLPKTPTVIPAASETTGTGTTETLGTISATSTPTGAEIYVDDSFVGKTPATLRLKPGQHNIRMFMKDYKNWSQLATVQAGSEVHLAPALEKAD